MYYLLFSSISSLTCKDYETDNEDCDENTDSINLPNILMKYL